MTRRTLGWKDTLGECRHLVIGTTIERRRRSRSSCFSIIRWPDHQMAQSILSPHHVLEGQPVMDNQGRAFQFGQLVSPELRDQPGDGFTAGANQL